MSSLDFVRTELVRRGGREFKVIAAATGVKRCTLWRIAVGRTTNPRHDTVEQLRKYLAQ